MSSLRWYYDPFDSYERLFDDTLSTRILHPFSGSRTGETGREPSFRPRMNMHEDPDGSNVTASFELPGVKPDEVHIDVVQDRLTISGETASTQEHEERGYKIRERNTGKYTRTLMLPQGTKPNDVRAKMENGLLNVTFPKAQPQQQPQRITIE